MMAYRCFPSLNIHYAARCSIILPWPTMAYRHLALVNMTRPVALSSVPHELSGLVKLRTESQGPDKAAAQAESCSNSNQHQPTSTSTSHPTSTNISQHQPTSINISQHQPSIIIQLSKQTVTSPKHPTATLNC